MSSAHLHAHDETMPEPRLKEVGPGISVYVQLDGSWGLNNPGFLAGRDAVTLIDTCFTERRARALRAAIAGVSPHPVRTLVNTHHHGDHTYGNYLFPEATIVGHRLCREAGIETGLSIKPLFPGVEWGAIQVAPPTVTFDERLPLYVDELRLEALFVGPAHPTNDVVIWIPEQRLLFAVDLVFNRCTPFVLQGSLVGHLRALETLRALGAETVVPGHGDVCGPEGIEDAFSYLGFVQELAACGFAAGGAPLDAAANGAAERRGLRRACLTSVSARIVTRACRYRAQQRSVLARDQRRSSPPLLR